MQMAFAKKNTLLIGVILLFALLGLTSSIALAQPVNVKFWTPFTGPDGATIEQMVKEFNSTTGKERGVQVDLLIVPWDDYYTKLTVAIASGTGPDLAINHSDRISGYVDQGALTPLDRDQLAIRGIQKKDYIAALWDAGEIDGKQYAVPIDAFPRHLYYNKTLFRRAGLDENSPPTNLTELTTMAKKLTKEDQWGLWFGLEGSWTARDFYSIYWQFNDDVLTSDMMRVDSDFEKTAKEVFSIRSDFLWEHQTTPTTPSEYVPLMAQNKLGIAVAQITDLPALEQADGLDFGAAPVPKLGDTEAAFTLGHNFVIPRKRNLDQDVLAGTQEFIQWFTEHGLAWAIGGKIPSNLNVLNSEAFQDLPIQSTVATQMSYVKLPPLTPNASLLTGAIQTYAERIYAQQGSLEQNIAQMAQEINKVMSQ